MVLTVTLNPVLEHRFSVDKINIDSSNRSATDILTAGGKGINISRQLNMLRIDNLAITFAGGNNGKHLRRILAEEKINNVLISTKDETRFSINVREKNCGTVTAFFSPNSIVSSVEKKSFHEKFEKIVANATIVVFAGSSLSTEMDYFFSYAIDYANSLDKITVLDTYGNHLQSCINASPMIFHSNIKEVEESLKIDLSDDEKKIDFLKYLYSKGIKFSFLTDGKNPLFVSQYDFAFKILPPLIEEKDATGSGDAFVAGLIYGFEKSLIFQDTLKTAVSLGAVNASVYETCNISYEQIEKYFNNVKILSVGKKLKIIDDSPSK